MGYNGLKRTVLFTFAVICVLIVSVAVVNYIEASFADDAISVVGNLIYGENVTLTLDAASDADSYYWDYLSNGHYYACVGDNESATYLFTADFTGERTFRCVYEKNGETYFESVTINVTRRPVRLKLNKTEAFYGEESELALVADEVLDETNFGLAVGDTINLFDYELDLTTCGIKYVEAYTMSPYYTVNCDVNTFNYKRRPIVLSVAYSECEYGDEIVPALSVSDSELSMGLVDGDSVNAFLGNVTFNVEYADDPLGLKTVTGTCADCNIGKYTIVGIESGQVLINPKRVSINLIDTTVQYGDEIYADFIVDGLVADVDVNLFEFEFESSVTGIGTFPITAQVLSCPTYYAVDNVYGANVIIAKREIVFAVTSTKVYGEDYEFSYAYATSSRQILNIDQNYIEISITYNNGVVCTATGCEDFYDISFDVAETVYLPRPLEIVLGDATVEYGTATLDLPIDSYSGLVNGDSLPVLFCTTEYGDCGEYVLTAGFTLSDNYIITVTPATLTVTPRPLTVTINDVNVLYGQAEATLTYTIKSGAVVYGDDINIVLERASGNDVGEYEIRGRSANPNYAVEFVNGRYIVEKGVLNINFVEISENEMYSCEYVYGVTPGIYHVSGFAVKYVFVQDGKEVERANVGECDIYGKFEETENYCASMVYLDTITIKPLPITVRALDASKKEKESDPKTFDYEIADGKLLEGDALSGKLSRDVGESVGAYAITRGTLDNSNYTITFNEGTFTIERITALRVKTALIISACLIVGTFITAFATIKFKNGKKR